MKGKIWKNPLMLSIMAVLLVAASAVVPVSSSPETLFVDPAEIIDATKVAGTTFSVSIKVDAGVLNLWGFGITVRYATAVLTATMVTYNTAVFPMTWPYTIDDVAGYVEGAAATGYGMPGVNGPQWLMKIDFKVDDLGESPLNIDETVTWLMDPAGSTISVTIVDGYFSNIAPPVPGVYEANLVRKSAWPEHHHWVLRKDPDQTLFGKVKNLGTVNTKVYVEFRIHNEDGLWSITRTTDTVEISPGTIVDLTYTLLPAELRIVPGKYYVDARAYYADATGAFVPGVKIKSFSFAVVP